ncbi:MAG: hypothetical protein PUE04_10155 [Lachnospira sp.]|nr:hypothetical protein [Lachnospira sp.]
MRTHSGIDKQKALKVFVILVFAFIFACAWIDEGEFLIKPLAGVILNDDSLYMRYLAYNRGTDFTVTGDSGVDWKIKKHNYFINTVIPKNYEENNIEVSVTESGAVFIQGNNEGDELEVPLNGQSQVFPEGKYEYYLLTDSSDVVQDISIEWLETSEKSEKSDDVVESLQYPDDHGEIECVSGKKYQCVLKIPEEADVSEGITLYLMMIRKQQNDTEIKNFEFDAEYPVSYLKAVHPYSNQKYGKVFVISKKDYSSMSAREQRVFQNNISFLYFPQYTYVSVLFEDGTGIQFDGTDSQQALYGEMDSSGVIVGRSIKVNPEEIPDGAVDKS